MSIQTKTSAKAAKDLDKIIGKKVNELRINKNITRQFLAKEIGVTHQQLQKYVNGTNRITATRLVEIAHILDTPIMYFFEESDDKQVLQDILLEQESITMMKNFAKINDNSHRETINSLINIFLEDEEKAAA